MNQLIVVFLSLSDCHFVMKVFAKNNAFSRGSFVHRSHVFSSCEDRGKGSTSFPRLFSFEKFLRKKALEMRLGEGVADPRPYLNLRPNWIPQSRGKLYSRPGPLLIYGLHKLASTFWRSHSANACKKIEIPSMQEKRSRKGTGSGDSFSLMFLYRRFPTGRGKTRKSWNSRISFSRPRHGM